MLINSVYDFCNVANPVKWITPLTVYLLSVLLSQIRSFLLPKFQRLLAAFDSELNKLRAGRGNRVKKHRSELKYSLSEKTLFGQYSALA
ncbi:hypothetical protein TNCT_532351 [Trichonephila clavata]|uniref:Uncharacterized protein n=1 Tax=Trichonephila clavata TaxID=2740835 RepID=A0A8X6I7W0_TRICU|nr:hypothetical protein TNCT_532351 [Trichonephila clavata]